MQSRGGAQTGLKTPSERHRQYRWRSREIRSGKPFGLCEKAPKKRRPCDCRVRKPKVTEGPAVLPDTRICQRVQGTGANWVVRASRPERRPSLRSVARPRLHKEATSPSLRSVADEASVGNYGASATGRSASSPSEGFPERSAPKTPPTATSPAPWRGSSPIRRSRRRRPSGVRRRRVSGPDHVDGLDRDQSVEGVGDARVRLRRPAATKVCVPPPEGRKTLKVSCCPSPSAAKVFQEVITPARGISKLIDGSDTDPSIAWRGQ
jgi:hypothetical protein